VLKVERERIKWRSLCYSLVRTSLPRVAAVGYLNIRIDNAYKSRIRNEWLTLTTYSRGLCEDDVKTNGVVN
jgi:hypothetical protein